MGSLEDAVLTLERELRGVEQAFRDLATGSSTVTEVHDDAVNSTTPRDAAWRPGGTDAEAPAGDSATPGVPGFSLSTDLHGGGRPLGAGGADLTDRTGA
jgi:hypothetical protein